MPAWRPTACAMWSTRCASNVFPRRARAKRTGCRSRRPSARSPAHRPCLGDPPPAPAGQLLVGRSGVGGQGGIELEAAPHDLDVVFAEALERRLQVALPDVAPRAHAAALSSVVGGVLGTEGEMLAAGSMFPRSGRLRHQSLGQLRACDRSHRLPEVERAAQVGLTAGPVAHVDPRARVKEPGQRLLGPATRHGEPIRSLGLPLGGDQLRSLEPVPRALDPEGREPVDLVGQGKGEGEPGHPDAPLISPSTASTASSKRRATRWGASRPPAIPPITAASQRRKQRLWLARAASEVEGVLVSRRAASTSPRAHRSFARLL